MIYQHPDIFYTKLTVQCIAYFIKISSELSNYYRVKIEFYVHSRTRQRVLWTFTATDQFIYSTGKVCKWSKTCTHFLMWFAIGLQSESRICFLYCGRRTARAFADFKCRKRGDYATEERWGSAHGEKRPKVEKHCTRGRDRIEECGFFSVRSEGNVV